MTNKRSADKKASSLIPVAIKRSMVTDDGSGVFVISLDDAIAHESMHDIIRDAETEYVASLETWKELLEKIRDDRSSSLTRWRLADSILKFNRKLQVKYKMHLTNLLEAVSRDLGLSDSALGYIMKLRREFSYAEIRSYNINWSRFQEILNIKDLKQMRKCAVLVKRKPTMRDREIRELAKKANSRN